MIRVSFWIEREDGPGHHLIVTHKMSEVPMVGDTVDLDGNWYVVKDRDWIMGSASVRKPDLSIYLSRAV